MSSTTSLDNLLDSAGLGEGATSAMQLTADTLGPAIQAGLGDITLDDIENSEVVLVTVLVDDSSSIRAAGNTDAVRTGHNELVKALTDSKQSASVLISCRYLNDGYGTDHGVLYPYRQLDGADELTDQNYNPQGGTPLYDQIAVTLTGVAAKMAEFENGGVAARAITIIVTDGADQHSRSNDARSIKPMVEELLLTEQHIIAAMGIDDGGYTDFSQVFEDIGVLPDWILTPGNSPTEVRKAFQVVSQSAVRASQTAGSFSQTALGGFGGQ